MTIKQEATYEWYRKQYEETKKKVQEECSGDWFWKNRTAEEQMINQLVYMTQLRNILIGIEMAIDTE